MKIYQNSMKYFSKHVVINSIAHVAGGFGLALVLQHFLNGNAFLPVRVGWILLVFSVIIHIHSMLNYQD